MSIGNPAQDRPADYRKFELKELGVDTDAFLQHVRPFYDSFPWDMHDVVRYAVAEPTRRRVIAEFALGLREHAWDVLRVPAVPYVQPDCGGVDRSARVFPEAPIELTEHSELLKFQTAVADIVLAVRSDVTKLRMVLTFLRTVHEEGRAGICTFEGQPHMDGADYIVSALVTNRINLKAWSGESSVHTLNREMLMSTVLQPGEGIFQDDRNLMHNITDIKRDKPGEAGIRDIVGIDIQLIS